MIAPKTGRDRVVAAGKQPAGILIAAAQLKAERHLRRGVDDGVVELDALDGQRSSVQPRCS